MAPDETQSPPPAPDVDVQCPDCAATLEQPASSQRRAATDGGGYEPNIDDERELFGVDVACDGCGAELGVYFFP